MARLPRATAPADNTGGPSTTLIVGVVCGVLGGALLLLFAARAILRFRLFRPRATPLPPVQQLAHHRAHASLARARGADTEWLEPGGRRSYAPAASSEGSAISLVRHAGTTSPGSSSPVGWEHASPNSPGADLPVPHRPFLEHRASMSTSSEGSLPSSPGTPASEASGSAFHTAASSSGSLAARSRSRSRPHHSRGPSRPHSTHSAGSRGAPHSRRNTMHIVLPAPLAPQLENWAQAMSEDPLQQPQPQRPRRTSHRISAMSDSPAIDTWVQRSIRSPSRERVDSNASRSRSTSRTPKRRSKAVSVVGTPTHSRSGSTQTASIPQGVPPIPALRVSYIPSVDSGVSFDPLAEEETLRGRKPAP